VSRRADFPGTMERMFVFFPRARTDLPPDAARFLDGNARNVRQMRAALHNGVESRVDYLVGARTEIRSRGLPFA
jgi:hypothetical protein